MNPADSLSTVALHVIAALLVGALLGSAWDAWRERRHRKKALRNFDRIAIDVLRSMHERHRNR